MCYRYGFPAGLLGILGEAVPPDSPNPVPVSDKKMSFPTLVFRSDL